MLYCITKTTDNCYIYDGSKPPTDEAIVIGRFVVSWKDDIENIWGIEIASLEDILNLTEKYAIVLFKIGDCDTADIPLPFDENAYGKIIYNEDVVEKPKYCIEIYDNYRE